MLTNIICDPFDCNPLYWLQYKSRRDLQRIYLVFNVPSYHETWNAEKHFNVMSHILLYMENVK